MRSTRIPCEIEWYRAVGIFALRLYTGNVETQGVFDVTGLKECPQGLDVMQLPTDQSIAIMNHHFRDWSRILTGNSKKSAWVKQKTFLQFTVFNYCQFFLSRITFCQRLIWLKIRLSP